MITICSLLLTMKGAVSMNPATPTSRHSYSHGRRPSVQLLVFTLLGSCSSESAYLAPLRFFVTWVMSLLGLTTSLILLLIIRLEDSQERRLCCTFASLDRAVSYFRVSSTRIATYTEVTKKYTNLGTVAVVAITSDMH